MSKTILISGGSKGLGKELVFSCLHASHKVATFSRSKTSFIEEMQKQYPDSFMWSQIDADDYEAMNNFCCEVNDKLKTIDVLINNVGIGLDGVLTMMSNEDISKLLQVNLGSLILLSKICLKYMLIQQKGSIINISSIVAHSGFKGLSVYSATKGGINSFSASLAREYGSCGINVNTVSPGFLETEMTEKLTDQQVNQIIRKTPKGRLGKASDVVGTIKFLISDDSDFITGQNFIIDGGCTA